MSVLQNLHVIGSHAIYQWYSIKFWGGIYYNNLKPGENKGHQLCNIIFISLQIYCNIEKISDSLNKRFFIKLIYSSWNQSIKLIGTNNVINTQKMVKLFGNISVKLE